MLCKRVLTLGGNHPRRTPILREEVRGALCESGTLRSLRRDAIELASRRTVFAPLKKRSQHGPETV